MVEKNGFRNETPNIFVAYLDIMGFKDRVFREKHEDVKKMLDSLRPAIETIEKEARKRLEDQIKLKDNGKKGDTDPSSVFPVSFSDSIILFSNNDSDDSADRIIVDTAYIFSEAIEHEIPMKGSIAFGEMTVDIERSLFFGKPLIDSYELHKELQIYGIALHHTAQKQLRQLKNTGVKDSLVSDYLVPMKSGKIKHHFVNWPYFSENSRDYVNKLYSSVSGTPRKYVDNTLEYFDWLDKEKEKWEKKKAKDIPI
jgi:hypothetical protein